MRLQQRKDMGLFGDGLEDLFAGRDTMEAEAAALNVAEVLVILANHATGSKFSGG